MTCKLLDELFSLGATSPDRKASIRVIKLTFTGWVEGHPSSMSSGSGTANLEYQAGKVIESTIDGIIRLYAVPARLVGDLNYTDNNQGVYSTTIQILAPEVLSIAGTEMYSVTFSQNGGALNGSYNAICEGPPVIAGPSGCPDMVGGVFSLNIVGLFAGQAAITVLGERL
jgi:hypothetical protein